VEKADEQALDKVVKRAAKDILDVAGQVKAKVIVIYPYAHLSSNLSKLEVARDAVPKLEAAVKELGGAGIEVHHSPFGWYKSFDIACKGHPLSELSRQINASELEAVAAAEAKAEPKEEAPVITREDIVKGIKSKYFVLCEDGTELFLDLKDAKTLEQLDAIKTPQMASVKTFIMGEEMVGMGPKKEPPSIKAMQRLELCDYEPATDSGHFRFYPKGQVVFELLHDWCYHIAHERLRCLEIDTPILYDWSRPEIRGQAASFHERHYSLKTIEGREFVLRFAGDFGLFRMFSDATLSYKNLPIKIYEFSKSFRFEQRGELAGLKRVRGFHMPDIHSFARDLEEAWDEFFDIYKAYADFSDATGVEYMVTFRIEKDFYEKYKGKLVELCKYSKKPAYIELLSGRKHYWAVKLEFNGIDSVGGACQLSTDQVDVEDAERYGILYTDKDGTKKGCVICHSSIGSLERWMYCILEQALKSEKPAFPLWLAPIQIRLLPVSDVFLDDCIAIAAKLHARVDVDDRGEKLGKMIRDAEQEWINLIAVYGEKEKASGMLNVRSRDGKQMSMTIDELNAFMAKETAGYPFKLLNTPMLLTRRPKFRG
jgi:threonyl-tRNA synthetase